MSVDFSLRRRKLARAMGLTVGGALLPPWAAAKAPGAPVYIAVDAEFSHASSTSAQAIAAGVKLAVSEVNAAGGVLEGRPVDVLLRDNRGVPSRATANLHELAAVKDLVGVFCGKFSPVAVEAISMVHREQLVYLDAWAAVDSIVENGHSPNYVFRLAPKDSWAMDAMLAALERRKLFSFCAVLPNTAWGRSCYSAIQSKLVKYRHLRVASSQWYNWGIDSFERSLDACDESKAQAIIFVGNETEGSLLLNEMVRRPAERRRPIICHAGVIGGDLFKLAPGGASLLDLSFVQTFALDASNSSRARVVLRDARKLLGLGQHAPIPSQVGLVQAYDLCHLLIHAIQLAQCTNRARIRDALEHVGPFRGLIKYYLAPFAPGRHEALTRKDVFLARFNSEGYVFRDGRV